MGEVKGGGGVSGGGGGMGEVEGGGGSGEVEGGGGVSGGGGGGCCCVGFLASAIDEKILEQQEFSRNASKCWKSHRPIVTQSSRLVARPRAALRRARHLGAGGRGRVRRGRTAATARPLWRGHRLLLRQINLAGTSAVEPHLPLGDVLHRSRLARRRLQQGSEMPLGRLYRLHTQRLAAFSAAAARADLIGRCVVAGLTAGLAACGGAGAAAASAPWRRCASRRLTSSAFLPPASRPAAVSASRSSATRSFAGWASRASRLSPAQEGSRRLQGGL